MQPFSPEHVAPRFDACIHAIGGFAAAARLLKLKTAWGVQKWRVDGVPPERVIALCGLCSWSVTPHELRPDIYPSRDDGLPPELKGRAA